MMTERNDSAASSRPPQLGVRITRVSLIVALIGAACAWLGEKELGMVLAFSGIIGSSLGMLVHSTLLNRHLRR